MEPVTIVGTWIGNTIYDSNTITLDCMGTERSNINITPYLPNALPKISNVITVPMNHHAPFTSFQLSLVSNFADTWVGKRLGGVAYRWQHVHDFNELTADIQEIVVTIWNGHDEDLPITYDFIPMNYAIQIASYVPTSIPPKGHISIKLRVFRTIGIIADVNYDVIFRTGKDEILSVNLRFRKELPGFLDLGVIVADTTADFLLWNPYKEPATFTVDLPPSTYGIECLLNQSVTIQPYEYKSIPVKAFSKSGAPEITDINSIIVRSNYGDVVPVGIKLIRAMVMTIPPDWSKGIIERIEYLTKIFVSYDGHEQRVDLRTIPRQQWVYDFITISEEEVALHDALLWAGIGRRMILPLWVDSRQLQQPISPGTLTFNVSTSYGDFGVDQYVLIFKDFLTWEIVPISTFTSSTITLKHPILNSWDIGVEIVPTKAVRVIEQLTSRDDTRSIQSASITFEGEG